MATNDIKAFSAAGGANVLTQAEYLAIAALSTGFTSGKASSKEVNKVLRQSSFVAAAVAQFISDLASVDVLDDGNVAGLTANFISAISAKSLSRTNPFADIKSDGTGATARSNLDLKSAALRDVGSGANQIPDMTLFGMSMGQTGYQKLPSGMIIQWGVVGMQSDGNAYASLPVTFPQGIHGGIAVEAASSGWTANSCVVAAIDVNASSKTAVTVRARSIVGTNGPTVNVSGVSVRYYVWGQ